MSDEWRCAMRREDSAGAAGYTVHIEGLCTDPNLLALYNQLNAANGPRYVLSRSQYPLPVLPAGTAHRRGARQRSGRRRRGHRQLHGSALVQRVVADPARLHGHVPASRVERVVRIRPVETTEAARPPLGQRARSVSRLCLSISISMPSVSLWFSLPHAHRVSQTTELCAKMPYTIQ